MAWPFFLTTTMLCRRLLVVAGLRSVDYRAVLPLLGGAGGLRTTARHRPHTARGRSPTPCHDRPVRPRDLPSGTEVSMLYVNILYNIISYFIIIYYIIPYYDILYHYILYYI